ncbi:MAG: hypothetical protein EDM05_59430 [Leptolyngbya sp. IPPAS B-1204]|nr:hypothetical protein [Elainella sp. C42_A2020_010]RNJ65147.1 MAG: hypothetical protein EDM05_32665 [Leptolyngbya sp. IPPAS B-1204]
MKSNQSHSAARSAAPASGSGAPSVPISVYRELAAELQATRAMVDSLNSKNQQLGQENLMLRQEMQRVVQSVLSLQPWINADHGLYSIPPRPPQQGTPSMADRPTWEETAAASAMAARLRTPGEPQGEWLTEEAATPQRIEQTKAAKGLGGLWLTLTVLVVVLSAFGAGFMIMRPFLPTSK